MTDNPCAAERIPEHVPAHLVKPWDYADAPGAERDVHWANTILLDGPEIFYSPDILVASQIGGWQVTRAHLIREILRDSENFTVHNQTGFPQIIGENWDLLPLEVEGEAHAKYRALLNPYFSPGHLKGLEEKVRIAAINMVEQGIGPEGMDFQSKLGDPFPVSVFLHVMGLPLEDMATFLGWVHGILHSSTLERVRAAATELKEYILTAAAERRRAPGDDLFSAIVGTKLEGRDLRDDECLGIVFTLFLAGLDTVANTLGFSFRYLADNPDQQRLLRTNRELIPAAVHELLRAFPPATTVRIVKRDIDFHGVQLKQGDVVRMLVQIAGRDGGGYDRTTLDFRRQAASQLSFGMGPHVCLGQHLARMEMRIALNEWLPRLPEFRLSEERPPVFEPHGVWGVKTLPIVWDTSN